MAAVPGTVADSADALLQRYLAVRARSLALCATLAPEDFVVQTMADVSPTKWHLAHVTWFFETFVLQPHVADYRAFDERYAFLFNSYYYTAGDMHMRAHRGDLSRPTVAEVRDYRQHVDTAMTGLLRRNDDAALAAVVELGLQHEQQHQELLLTDIKHVFSRNPLHPAVRDDLKMPASGAAAAQGWLQHSGGIVEIGDDASAGFVYDNETPRHEVLLRDFEIADRLVTNAEFAEFIADDGYSDSTLWLSDGWATLQQHGWRQPLYWLDDAQEFIVATEAGMDSLVAHPDECIPTLIGYFDTDVARQRHRPPAPARGCGRSPGTPGTRRRLRDI